MHCNSEPWGVDVGVALEVWHRALVQERLEQKETDYQGMFSMAKHASL